MAFYINVTWPDGKRETVSKADHPETAIILRRMYRKWFGDDIENIMVETRPVINTPIDPGLKFSDEDTEDPYYEWPDPHPFS